MVKFSLKKYSIIRLIMILFFFYIGTSLGSISAHARIENDSTGSSGEIYSGSDDASSQGQEKEKKAQETAKSIKKVNDSTSTSNHSWLSGVEQDIYTGKTTDDGKTEKAVVPDKPNIVERFFISIICGVADTLDGWCKNLYMDLNNIVFGRIGGGGIPISTNGSTNKVSLFTFELRKGNPYGIVATTAYVTIRGIVYILMILFVFYKFIAASYSGSSSRAREALKDAVKSCVMYFALLAVMPYIMDVFLYLRDVILYAVGVKGAQDVLGLSSNHTLFDAFSTEASKSLVNSVMYLSSKALNIIFATQYIGTALSFVISFVVFPFVCLNAYIDKNALITWVKNVRSYALTPIIDCVLLLIPSIIGQIGQGITAVAVVQLFVCAMVIPARSVIKQQLGLNNTGLESAGMGALSGGLALALGASKMAKGIKGGINNLRESKADSNMAEYYEGLDDADNTARNEFVDMLNARNGYGAGENGYKRLAGIDNQMVGAVGLEKIDGMPVNTTMSDLPEGAYVDSISTGGFSNKDIAGASGGIHTSGVAADNIINLGRQDVAEKYANTSNFENREFSGISNQRKAELYRERAKAKRIAGLTTIGGNALGGLAGATLGGAGGAFLDAKGKASLAIMSSAAGGIASSGAAKLGVKTADLAMDARQKVEDMFINVETGRGSVEFEKSGSSGYSQSGLSVGGSESIGTLAHFESGSIGNPVDKETEIFISNNKSSFNEMYASVTDFTSSPQKSDWVEDIHERIREDKKFSTPEKKTSQFKEQIKSHMTNEFMEQLTTSKDIKWDADEKKNEMLREKSRIWFEKGLEEPGYKGLSDSVLKAGNWTFDKL